MNPYEILGVSSDSTDAEIEHAYYAIVEKYRPDSESDNPLAYLAKEKIEQATEAYNEIKRNRLTPAPQGEPSQFIDIRRLINNNMVNEASELLDGVPIGNRDAEWYFLKGSVQYSRGWLEDAYENFTRAAQLNPENAEYRAALNQLEWQRRTGQPFGGGSAQPNMSPLQCNVCDICTATCCANMCCNSLTRCG